jgi:hypothetical protein
MILVHFKKHSCVSKQDFCLVEIWNPPIAINPDNIVAIFPRSKSKRDGSESVRSSDSWCELYMVNGGCWDVDGTYEEVTNKLSSPL